MSRSEILSFLFKKLDLKIDALENKAISTSFRIVTPESKIESNMSQSSFGTYSNSTHQTTVKVNLDDMTSL